MYAKQMRLMISFLLTFYICSLTADTVYKTVDENGNIIFTDKPSEDAEEVKIDKLQTIDNPNPSKFRPTPRTKDEDQSSPYKTFVVTNPENGAAIRSNNGNITISLSLEPALKTGHKIIISMDGKEVGTGSSVSLQNVERGTHGISARVIGRSDNTLISTTSSFSLLRATQ